MLTYFHVGTKSKMLGIYISKFKLKYMTSKNENSGKMSLSFLRVGVGGIYQKYRNSILTNVTLAEAERNSPLREPMKIETFLHFCYF